MNRFTELITLLLVLAVSTCDSDNQPECPECVVECNDGKLHECCIDDDCLENPDVADCAHDYIICNDDYECQCACYEEGADCSRDPEACCSGMECDIFTNTCITVPVCETDTDCCKEYPFLCNDPCRSRLYCRNGICHSDEYHCTRDTDCAGGCFCIGGVCTYIDCGSEIKECVVLPSSVVTRTGTTARLVATPYLNSGAVAPGFSFDWHSSNTEVADVAGGLVTGGATTGSATITAELQACPNTFCTAEAMNYGAVAAGHTRVLVVDELSNELVVGATVVAGSETPVTTDNQGIAEFAVELGEANPGDITVSKRDYHYATLKSVKTNDVIVHLSPLHNLDFSQDPPAKQAGGIKGKFDFGMIRCEEPLKTCDVSFGLAGLSIPPSLTRLGRGMLTGGFIKTTVDLGNGPEEVLLEDGLVLCLNQTCHKEYFTPTGAPGNRIAWGLGGKLDLADLTDKLEPIINGGGKIDYGLVARGLMPLFANFYTSMVPNVDIRPRPLVSDVNDIDGDPATLEVPDYDNFPRQDMTLKVKMDQTMTFNAPALPVGVYDAVIVRGGIVVRGAGFVPMGISLGVDSIDELDLPDGVIDDPIVLNVADVAGRIPEGQFQRVIIALAVKLEDDGGPERWAGQVLFVDSFSGTHTLPPFLPPVVATYDPQGRRLEISQMPIGVDLLQAVFAGEKESSWHVLTEDFGSFDLPAAPPEGDRADSVGVYAVDLCTGGYQELVEFNDLNMGNLIENLQAFSYSEVP